MKCSMVLFKDQKMAQTDLCTINYGDVTPIYSDTSGITVYDSEICTLYR